METIFEVLKETEIKETVLKDFKKTTTELTEAQKREKIIRDTAEEIMPGFWSLEPMTQQMYDQLVDSGIVRYNYMSDETYCGECDACNDGYEEDCEDKTYDTKGDYFSLIIKFPEATIKNDAGDRYPIKDLYIAIPFSEDFESILTTSFVAIRTTCTTKEIHGGYVHSHVNLRGGSTYIKDYFSWRGLCLGGTTALTELNQNLQDGIVDAKTMHELLLMLHVFVGWESSAGGPYRFFKELRYPSQTDSSSSTCSLAQTPVDVIQRNPSDSISLLYSKIYNKTLEILYNSEDIEAPEITGNFHNLGVTNVYASIMPALKAACIEIFLENYKEDEKQAIVYFKYVFINGGTDVLSGLKGHNVYNYDFYEKIVSDYDSLDLSKIIPFNKEAIKANIIFDEEGLVQQTNFSTDKLLECDISELLLTHFTRVYLINIKQFKLNQLLK